MSICVLYVFIVVIAFAITANPAFGVCVLIGFLNVWNLRNT